MEESVWREMRTQSREWIQEDHWEIIEFEKGDAGGMECSS